MTDYDFGPTIIERELGIKKAKYTNAIEGLVEKGYLIPLEKKGYYDFTKFLKLLTRINIIMSLLTEKNFRFNFHVFLRIP